MANILLGVTGSVASILTPDLFQKLHREGHQVKVVATRPSLYFFNPIEIHPGHSHLDQRDPNLVILDEDEWPGKEEGRRYQRSDKVLHIELRRWADLFVIAPLDANTLAKLANGICDNCLTCVWRAWDRNRPLVLAPAMNTMMWEHPATGRHLRQLASDSGVNELAPVSDLVELVHKINEKSTSLFIVPPQIKRLACDDVGVGAMGSVEEIGNAVKEMLTRVAKADWAIPPRKTL